jgi:hypothetical protein
MLTTRQLNAIQARCDKASTAPWTAYYDGEGEWTIAESREGPFTYGVVCSADMKTKDARFIAAARTDIPLLVEEIRNLRSRLAKARAELAGDEMPNVETKETP